MPMAAVAEMVVPVALQRLMERMAALVAVADIPLPASVAVALVLDQPEQPPEYSPLAVAVADIPAALALTERKSTAARTVGMEETLSTTTTKASNRQSKTPRYDMAGFPMAAKVITPRLLRVVERAAFLNNRVVT